MAGPENNDKRIEKLVRLLNAQAQAYGRAHDLSVKEVMIAMIEATARMNAAMIGPPRQGRSAKDFAQSAGEALTTRINQCVGMLKAGPGEVRH
jgi:inactivated superfamily I helicase